MKKLLALMAFLLLTQSAFAGGVDKLVCNDKTDKAGNVVKDKSGKVLQVCKTIKVHKKLDGAKPVPAK